jgi:sterol 24-C-methyltransferase
MGRARAGPQPQQRVIDYYNSWESRWCYALVLRGVKHFGYYPPGRERISMAEAQRLMVRRLAAALDLPGNALLLDAGCGEGAVALQLARERGWRVVGVDLLDWHVARARRRAAAQGLAGRVAFHAMDYTRLRFPDASFDGLYTMETLVHAPDAHEALREFRRVLRPGGRLALVEYSVCPREELTPLQRYGADLIVEGSGMHSLPGFVHGSFPGLLERAGFAEVAVEDLTPRVMPMLRRLATIFQLPYRLVALLGWQRVFINATAAVEGYRHLRDRDLWRYNIVTAWKAA